MLLALLIALLLGVTSWTITPWRSSTQYFNQTNNFSKIMKNALHKTKVKQRKQFQYT